MIGFKLLSVEKVTGHANLHVQYIQNYITFQNSIDKLVHKHYNSHKVTGHFMAWIYEKRLRYEKI